MSLIWRFQNSNIWLSRPRGNSITVYPSSKTKRRPNNWTGTIIDRKTREQYPADSTALWPVWIFEKTIQWELTEMREAYSSRPGIIQKYSDLWTVGQRFLMVLSSPNQTADTPSFPPRAHERCMFRKADQEFLLPEIPIRKWELHSRWRMSPGAHRLLEDATIVRSPR